MGGRRGDWWAPRTCGMNTTWTGLGRGGRGLVLDLGRAWPGKSGWAGSLDSSPACEPSFLIRQWVCWMGCLRGAIAASLGKEVLYVIQSSSWIYVKGGLNREPRLMRRGCFCALTSSSKRRTRSLTTLRAKEPGSKSWDLKAGTQRRHICDPTRHRHISGSYE